MGIKTPFFPSVSLNEVVVLHFFSDSFVLGVSVI
jgi:hypothetical protein